MIRKTVSNDEIAPVEIHGHDAWLHDNIEQTQDDEGQAMWTADEVIVRNVQGCDETAILADFDAFWRMGARDGMTDAQRVDELEQTQIATDEAICELYEMMIGADA